MTKIERIEAVPVAVPLRTPFRSALGTMTESRRGIVIATTDDGVVGLGEIALIWHGDGARLCRDVDELLAPALVGSTPFDIARLHAVARDVLAFGRHSLAAIAGVEMACYDLQGKLTGKPVHQLLGGCARERIPLSMSLPMCEEAAMLAQAREHVAAGFSTLKVKVGLDAERDVAAVAALRRELGSDVAIRVDANMGWRQAKEALRVLRRLEPYDVLSVEQPLPPDDLDGLRLLRQRSDVPIMVDESVWSPADAWRVVQHGAADLINVYVSEAGGLAPARRIAELCALSGVGLAVGSMPELTIGTSAAAHFAFASPVLDHPSDIAGHLYHADDVVRGDLRIEQGHLLPPERPGLGVELDEVRLETYRLR